MNPKLLLLVVVTAVLAPLAGADKLVLKEEAYVRGPKVLLGDIARIEGENADALARIELMTAANPGDSKQMSAALVSTRLEHAGFDRLDVQVEGAPRVRATTLHLEVTPAQLSESLRDYIQTNMPWDLQDAMIDVQAPAGTIRTTDGDLSIEWAANPQYRYFGPAAFRGAVTVDGVVQKTVTVRANVEAYAEVLVARRDIPRGTLISANDLDYRKLSMQQTPEGAIEDYTEAMGRVAKKTLLAGQPLSMRNLDMPIMVKRNQVVPVEVRLGGVLIQARGRAMSEARAGDPVLCANTESKEQFQGILREDGVVVVE
jgi:flagellar basal body P-ring formation protein FlgA